MGPKEALLTNKSPLEASAEYFLRMRNQRTAFEERHLSQPHNLLSVIRGGLRDFRGFSAASIFASELARGDGIVISEFDREMRDTHIKTLAEQIIAQGNLSRAV